MTSTHPDQKRYRLLVLGDSRVGKTCLIKRYLHNTFNERYKETVEDIYSRDFHIQGSVLPLDIYDTNFYYPDMRRVSMVSADAFMLVFAVDNVNSFKCVTELIQEISDRRPLDIDNLPMVLVGNKADIMEKKIYKETVYAYLKHLRMKKRIPYYETSSKTNDNVVDIFKSLLDQSDFPNIDKHQLPTDAERRRCTLRQSRANTIIDTSVSTTALTVIPSTAPTVIPSTAPTVIPKKTGPRRQSSQISVRCLSANRCDDLDEDIDELSINQSLREKSIDRDTNRSSDRRQKSTDRIDRHEKSIGWRENKWKLIDQDNDQSIIDQESDYDKSIGSINERRISRFTRALTLKKEKSITLQMDTASTPKPLEGPKRGLLTRHGSLMRRPMPQRLSLKMRKDTIDEPDESDCKIS